MPLQVAEAIAVAVTPERVWRALTDPVELIEWYAPGCRWEIPLLAVGAPARFFNTESDVQPATITLRHEEYETVPEAQRAAWLTADQGAVPAILAALARHVERA